MNPNKAISEFKKNKMGARPQVDWEVEASQEVETIYGRDKLYVERNFKKGSDGVRNIRLRKGNRSLNFDIESAHVIALCIKQISDEFVPDALKEDAVIKDEV